MKILRRLGVPTGDILVVSGEHGSLECLSLGDYGKEANIKADFLGLSRDPGIVTHRAMLPLEEKWVITVSTQYGCSMGCVFCDVPKVGPGWNATEADMLGQFDAAFGLHPEVKWSDRINLHYARMGEPTWNSAVITSARALRARFAKADAYRLHPIVSTMLPRSNRNLVAYLREWCSLKNSEFEGEAGLQLSINSTSDEERLAMFDGHALDLEEAARLVRSLPVPRGRKYALNFAVADWEIDAAKLARLFDPAVCMVKLTPMHRTAAAETNGLGTVAPTTLAPYAAHEERLRAAGFDVLVFIASAEEDLGRITCGNAILSGTLPLIPFTETLVK